MECPLKEKTPPDVAKMYRSHRDALVEAMKPAGFSEGDAIVYFGNNLEVLCGDSQFLLT